MSDYRKEFEAAAIKEGFDVSTNNNAPCYVYISAFTDVLYEGWQDCFDLTDYTHCPYENNTSERNVWSLGWRMAREYMYSKSA